MFDYSENASACVNFTWCVTFSEEDPIFATNDSAIPTQLSTLKLMTMMTKGVALGSIVLLTIGGNILVLVAVMFNLHLHSTTNYFIVNLAVADLLLGTTVLPFSASNEVLERWSFGQVFCDVWAAVDVLCCTASILSLCVISVDRYIGVTRPLTYSAIMTEKRSILLILIVWVASVVISIGPLFGWKEPPTDDQSVCTVTSHPGYVLFSVSGSFYIPTCVILIVYARIYRAAVRQTRFLERGIKTTKTSGDSSEGGSSVSEVTLRVHTGGKNVGGRLQSCDNLNTNASQCVQVMSGHQGRLVKFKRQKKAAKTLGIVVGVFILCWFPFFFILPLKSFCSACDVPDSLFQVFFWLGYCNSCLNPIIYAKSSREFKRAFQRILRCSVSGPSTAASGRTLDAPPSSVKQCTVALRSSTSMDASLTGRSCSRMSTGVGGRFGRKLSDVSYILEVEETGRSKSSEGTTTEESSVGKRKVNGDASISID